jgi:hypothetical protein
MKSEATLYCTVGYTVWEIREVFEVPRKSEKFCNERIDDFGSSQTSLQIAFLYKIFGTHSNMIILYEHQQDDVHILTI